MKSTNLVTLATALSSASFAFAQLSQHCRGSVCYSLSIPANAASSSSGDVFFQITAPATFEWVGLGQGSQMAGANIFMMYLSGDGNNVTVSPRLGSGHNQPQHNTAAQITLLEGSGVSGGQMTANVRCSSCHSWSGGSMDFSASSGTWIQASRAGPPVKSDDLGVNLDQHLNGQGSFDWDFSSAKSGSNTANPFVTSDATASNGMSTASAPSSSSTTAGSSHSTTAPAPKSSSSSSGADHIYYTPSDMLVSTHGILACLSFLAMMVGGILIRVAHFIGLVWVHAGLQIVAYMVYIAAFGIGVWLANKTDDLNSAHAIIGIILMVTLVAQPLFGWLHHKFYQQRHGRTTWSHVHIWIGRSALILATINGGLGLQLYGQSTGKYAAYGVVAGVLGGVYIAAVVWGELKRSQNRVGHVDNGLKNDHQLREIGSST